MSAPPPTPFPPAPWAMRGGAWIGFFRSDAPVVLPPGFTHVGGSGFVVIGLVRYLDGTLRYDEFFVASLARHGWRIGLYVHDMWVDDAASLWGGRRIWGLPKQLARFEWSDHTVRIADDAGPIATLWINPHTAIAPRLPAFAPAFGEVDGRIVFFVARAWARLGRAAMRLDDWSPRFGYGIRSQPLVSLAAKPFHLVVPPPRATS
jgi:hypothetical protein